MRIKEVIRVGIQPLPKCERVSQAMLSMTMMWHRRRKKNRWLVLNRFMSSAVFFRARKSSVIWDC